MLNKVKFEVRDKRNQIRHHKRLADKVSAYKFKLRPVNGKDVTSIKKDLEYRKLEKQV